jgi:hypothetical protein
MTLLGQLRSFSIGSLALLLLGASTVAAPREGGQRTTPARNAPSPTVPQTEPMDLDEGKSPQQMFSTSCSVCHQSAQGLAKGRSAGQLGSFLRQHYTTGTGQANTLAGYLTSGGLDRGSPAPVRATPADKPDRLEPAVTSRKPKPDEARRPDADVATTHPNRRIRNEDGSTQPVEGLVILPPGSEQLPEGENKPTDRRRETRPAEPVSPTHGRQRQPRPSDIRPAEAKPVEQPKPAEAAKPAESEPAPAVQAEAPRPPRDPAAAHSPLTEERPKPAPADVQEIPL